MEFRVSNAELFKRLKESPYLRKNRSAFVETAFHNAVETLVLQRGSISEDVEDTIRKKLVSFHVIFKRKVEQCSRSIAACESKETEWLAESISVPIIPVDEQEAAGVRKRRPGRPSTPYDAVGERSKRRRAASTAEQHGTHELVMAAALSAKSDKDPELSAVLKETIATPTRPSKLRRGMRDSAKLREARTLTPDEALAVKVSADMSTKSYNIVRKMTNKVSAKEVYPSRYKVAEARQKCFPDEHIKVTDNSAEVSLQAMLDHTTRRLIQAEIDHTQKEVDVTQTQPGTSEQQPSSSDVISGKLYCKWGFDGATGQSIYKQAVQSGTSMDEGSLFCSSVVPLRLDINEECVWTNSKPSSTRYCRPLHIQYVKETAAVSRQEMNNFFTQIEDLQPCGAKPTEMNDIDKVRQKVANKEAYQFGLSTLHAWIRLFELVLHIGYRLKLKVWSVKKAQRKEYLTEKKRIQSEFYDKMGLPVDQPRAGGAGSSNDGNTARRAFADPATFSSITGVDVGLITRFSVILRALASTKPVDPDKFQTFALQTAKEYCRLYPWFYMPASLHKLLMHGAEVIRSLMLPIGAYSEEAQESQNKNVKWCRLKRSRKTSRRDNTCDLFRALCVMSDPVVVGLIHSDVEARQRKSSRGSGKALLCDELDELLVQDETPTDTLDEQRTDSSDSESDSDSDEPEMERGDPTDLSCVLPSYYCVDDSSQG